MPRGVVFPGLPVRVSFATGAEFYSNVHAPRNLLTVLTRLCCGVCTRTQLLHPLCNVCRNGMQFLPAAELKPAATLETAPLALTGRGAPVASAGCKIASSRRGPG